jgi:CheY-like chemotaxis protein
MEPRTILLVDDYAPNLVALEAALEPLEQRLVKASSGEEALKFLLSESCALILLDVNMPGQDGIRDGGPDPFPAAHPRHPHPLRHRRDAA